MPVRYGHSHQAPPPLEGALRSVRRPGYGQEHEAEGYRDEQLPENRPAGPVDEEVRRDESYGRQHLPHPAA